LRMGRSSRYVKEQRSVCHLDTVEEFWESVNMNL